MIQLLGSSAMLPGKRSCGLWFSKMGRVAKGSSFSALMEELLVVPCPTRRRTGIVIQTRSA